MRDADATLYTRAGPEVAVASTKCHVAQLVAMHVLALYLAQVRGKYYPEEVAHQLECLQRLPERVQAAIDTAPAVTEVARQVEGVRDFFFIGRGVGNAMALEGALKLKEISYVHAEGYAAGELKHGPISLLDAECPLVAVVTRSSVYEKLISNVMEGRARDANVIAVATEGDPQIAGIADEVCWVPDTHEALSPVQPMRQLRQTSAVR